MADELERLASVARDFELEADDDFVDPKLLAAVIDRLQGKLCRVLNQAKKRGDHLLAGQTACAWVSVTCLMSRTAAADRLCVGEQLGHLPRIAAALSSGQIGYQATAVICHLSEQEHWIDYARRFSIKELRYLTYKAREVWDAEGFEKDNEEDYESNLLPLCYFHHRQVHEGGWQVVRAGEGVKFIPPDRVIPKRVRGPGMRWAA